MRRATVPSPPVASRGVRAASLRFRAPIERLWRSAHGAADSLSYGKVCGANPSFASGDFRACKPRHHRESASGVAVHGAPDAPSLPVCLPGVRSLAQRKRLLLPRSDNLTESASLSLTLTLLAVGAMHSLGETTPTVSLGSEGAVWR